MNYTKFIGIPFKEKDCFQLVKYIYKETFNKDILNTEIKHNESEKINNLYQDELDNWVKIDNPVEGAIMAIRLDSNYPKLVTHFAYCITENQIIHTTQKTDSCVENIAKYYKLCSGFYVHKDLI